VATLTFFVSSDLFKQILGKNPNKQNCSAVIMHSGIFSTHPHAINDYRFLEMLRSIYTKAEHYELREKYLI
jgi:hypothetical protein